MILPTLAPHVDAQREDAALGDQQADDEMSASYTESKGAADYWAGFDAHTDGKPCRPPFLEITAPRRYGDWSDGWHFANGDIQ